ncbi:ATP-dependent RNA helicase DbpA [Microbulbifer hainanensis]|uniref:ATP-dependent RNA helicase DbpA n=1 Tax=Microbulbifer hainanensis TaxID=2735675 RepID=UPI0018695C76|nr:ATP-dependent RNA helicase DbpA [Microbulbifer hainanensis]
MRIQPPNPESPLSKPASHAFAALPISTALRDNLADLGFRELTPIQSQALPALLEGRDVIGQAKTGSGKTVAFGLGVLNKLQAERFCVQALVLCPTRELADQVAQELRKLARAIHNVKILTLCGGMPFGPQLASLKHGAHIVVGTPGRIEEHVRKGKLSLERVQTLVLDEADRMLDMGFQATLDAIVDELPTDRQTLLFSATYPDSIEALAARVQRDPVMVQVGEQHTQSSIEQHFYQVGDNADRARALQQVLAYFQPESTVVFCNTKRETDEAADALRAASFAALALHGDMEQRERDQTLVCFANGSASVLVATDVAARGLDIEELGLVINYHLSRDPEVHVHRVGRTGRAGQRGIAASLVSSKEQYKVERLAQLLDQPVRTEPLPEPVRGFQPLRPAMVTLQIDGGKKQKVRPGDIVGALTGDNGISGEDVGKIRVFDFCAYVAVKREVSRAALAKLTKGKLKGRKFRVRVVGV